MKAVKVLDTLLMRVVKPIVILLGIAVAVLLAVGVFFRAVLDKPVFGLEEVMLLAVMWFYMLGAALASRERSHLSADFLEAFTENPVILRTAAIASTAISLFVALMVLTWSWDLVAWGFQKGQSTPVFAIPMWISQASLLFASVLFVLYLLRDLILELTGKPLHSAIEEEETL